MPVPYPALFLLICGMGLTGFVDDVFGDRGKRGFKGHIKSLFEGKPTTGLFKAAIRIEGL